MRQLLPTSVISARERCAIALFAIMAVGSLTACGQKNGLYLPQDEKAPPRPASSGEPAPSGQS